MTEFEQIKQYIEERLKEHKEQIDEHDDLTLMGQIHEDKMILNKIEEIIAKHDTMELDN